MSLKSSGLIVNRPALLWRDSLIIALNAMAGKGRQSPYRVLVVDETGRIKGMLTGRRVLEILVGHRGSSLLSKKGVKGILREPLSLFLDEPRNLFLEDDPLRGIVEYMSTSRSSYVIVITQTGTYKGVIDEKVLLERLAGKDFGIKLESVMSSPVYSVTPDTEILSTAKKMVEKRIRRLVVKRDRTLLGIVTITDILNHTIAAEKQATIIFCDISLDDVLRGKTEDIMSSEVYTVESGSDLGRAIDLLLQNDISGLIVLREGEIAGVISRKDALLASIKVLGVDGFVEAVAGE